MKRASWRRERKLCKACEERRARFRYRGRVRWEARHALCFECHRDLLNRHRTVAITGAIEAAA